VTALLTAAFLVAAPIVVAAPVAAIAAEAATTGKVNAVDAAKHVVNLTHGPIASLGWPAMTMDFGVAPAIDLSTLKPGDSVS
ncbi:copper-binding protein, partial [Mycobacterium tuberculosis]|nr:copper-binding protein [Mycobacterium tuberculosis]